MERHLSRRVRVRLPRRAAIAATFALFVLSGGTAHAAADGSPFLASTQASALHAYGVDGDGVTVAIIDTGVADVPGLDGAVVHQENFSAGPDAGDQYGHGTFVAGLVHQVAPKARIVSIKLSGADGAADVTQVMAALQWVVANRERWSIDVVNLSFGTDSRQATTASPLNFAVQRAWDAGIVVVASAGNAGKGGITKPGDDPLVITAGSSDDAMTTPIGDDQVASYSSIGPTHEGLAKPDVVTPGTKVVSLRAPGSTIDLANPLARIGETQFRGSGTSFSAPIVAGHVALMLDVLSLTPDQVKYGLMQTGIPILGPSAGQGSGTTQVGFALRLMYASVGRANRGVRRSSGRGRLHEARGRAIVSVVRADGVTTPVVGETTSALTSGDAALASFDSGEYVEPESWDASRWGESQWDASRWGASRWGNAEWGAAEWWASRWG